MPFGRLAGAGAPPARWPLAARLTTVPRRPMESARLMQHAPTIATSGKHITMNFTVYSGGYRILAPTVRFWQSIHTTVFIDLYVIEPTGVVTLASESYIVQQIVTFPSSGNWTVYCNGFELFVEIYE